jgi:hypothetical protein
MRYMMMVKSDENFQKSGPPPKELMEAIGRLGEEAFKAGKMVSMGGLQRSSEGAIVRVKGGKITVIDGPFTESKEVIGGFSIMNLASKEEAIEEARKFMELHTKYWPGWEADCEVRPMYEDGAQP